MAAAPAPAEAGRLSAAPLLIPSAIAEWGDEQLAALGPAPGLAGLRGAQLLAERAAISGYVSRGAVSPGGSCRLLDARDGGIALNLARDEDWDLLPAWLEAEVARDWEAVAIAVRERSVRALVERGREMGLAVAADELPEGTVGAAPSIRPLRGLLRTGSAAIVAPQHRGQGRSYKAAPRVIDLSSLWAGPLCGHLLQRLGAQVIKVESLRRPDGARRGPALFFDLLNAGKASVALDFATPEGRGRLRALLDSADIVIEASRPRALRQLGIDAEALCARRSSLVWVGITAYGRGPVTGNWIGYGDDVGVAAGLSALARAATGERRIVGDAIADPLTGLHAARRAWQAWQAGEGGVLDIALHAVVRRCLTEKGVGSIFPLPLPMPRKWIRPLFRGSGERGWRGGWGRTTRPCCGAWIRPIAGGGPGAPTRDCRRNRRRAS